MLCEFAIRRVFGETTINSFTQPEAAFETIKKDAIQNNASGSTILFLDINMPSMTGWDFLEIFKNLNSGIQQQFSIYILSSSVDSRDKEKAASNVLVKGFLSKPLTVESLGRIFTDQ
jgi:CheY-like chemotaxis protein